MAGIAFALALATVVVRTQAKSQSGLLSLGGSAGGWQYVDKFGFVTGQSKVSVRVRLIEGLNTTRSLPFLGYLDTKWQEVDSTLNHCERDSLARFRFDLQLPVGGDWGRWKDFPIHQNKRPHIWYFAVSNEACFNKAQAERLIEYEIKMLQPDGSHFSVEMRHMLLLNVISLLLFSCFLAYFGRRCWNSCQQIGFVHSVIWVLTAAMLLHFAGLVMHTIHLSVYSQNGAGLPSFGVLHEMLFMASQVVQSSLLIVIALGYTLFHSSLKELSLVKPIIAITALVHALLVAFGKTNDGASNKYHENEGIVGWLLLSIRLGLYVWFVIALHSSQQRGGLRLQHFLKEFRVAGSLYFLAFPMIFLVVQLFAPYLQHPIMQTGLMSMQALSHMWLSSLFFCRGNYFKVSVLSASLLPSFGTAGGCKLS